MKIGTQKPKRHLEEKEVRQNNRKIKIILTILICIFLISLIILYRLYDNSLKDYSYLKEDTSEHLVYTRYQQNNKEVPYINIVSKDIEKTNNDILNYCDQYKDDAEIKVYYEYSINGKYLSLVIKTRKDNDFTFKTYNISLKDRKEITDEQLLQMFNTNVDEVSDSIGRQLGRYYQLEVEDEYIEKELCDFSCYLKYRGIENYTDNISYYIKNGKLIVYKPFIFISVFQEEEFFTEESFEIIVAE